MTTDEIIKYFVESKFKEWKRVSRGEGLGNRLGMMMVGIQVTPKDYLAIPLSFRSYAEVRFKSTVRISLN